MKKSLLTLFTFCTVFCFGQKQAYVIYNSKGKKVSYEKMLKSLADQEVVLFGEYHDNPIAHWLELELAKENCTAVPTGKFLSRRKEEDEVEAELMEMDNESKSNFSTIAMKRASTGLLFGCVLFLLLLLLVVLVMIVVEDFNAMLYIFPLLDITSASSYPLSSSFWSFDCEKCILSRKSD